MTRPSDSERWAELCAAFDTLVELDTGERADRLAAIGATDPSARCALEELLEADANPPPGLGRIDEIFGAADHDVLKLVGRTVSHFRIVEPLATGGMGVVYRALDTHLARPVALKFPLPGQRLDGQVRERFLREARAAAALDHPNICGIYETGETEDGRLFLAMPLYAGVTLKARIARVGPLAVADALAIAVQIARGLQAAHGAGIVHRDLKPANAIILSEGTVKILDFGVARVGDATLTKSHDTLGTVSYMAPEQVRGEPVDRRADLWALGVLLYEMLTGKRPFEGEHEIAIAHAIVHSTPVRPSELRPEIPAELETLILGLLARQPAKRYPSASAVADELGALALPATLLKLRRWRPRRRPLLWASTLALVALAAGAGWLVRRGAGSGSPEPLAVAVPPFRNLSGGGESGYLAVALADEVATRLRRLKAVGVPGEQAGMVVRGSVRRSENEMWLEIDLFDGKQPDRVWTREYRGPSTSVQGLPGNATEGIVAALHLRVTPGERAMLRQVSTTNPEAYDLYLRGRAAQIADSLPLAQSYYARSRERDPEFAEARARLALLLLVLAPKDRTSVQRETARLEAEAALRLQPGMPEAHEALASYWGFQGEPLKEIGELERALAGHPNSSYLYGLLGDKLRDVGRREDAVAAYERASRLDPRNLLVHRSAAQIYSRLRRYDEAIAHWNQVIAMDSARDPFPQIIRGFAYLRRGNVDSLDAAISRVPLASDSGRLTTYAHWTLHRIRRRDAEAVAVLDSSGVAITGDRLLYRPLSLLRGQTLQRMGDSTRARSAYRAAKRLLEDSVAAHPRDAGMRVALGLAYAGLGRRAEAKREASTATELVPMSEYPIEATAFMGGAVEIYTQLGDADAALELIELLLAMPAGREISVPLLRLDPTFDPLRSDPRFEALIRRFSKD